MADLLALIVLGVGCLHGWQCLRSERAGLLAVAIWTTSLAFGLLPLLWGGGASAWGGPAAEQRSVLAQAAVLLFLAGLLVVDFAFRLRPTDGGGVRAFFHAAAQLSPWAVGAVVLAAWGARLTLFLQYGVTLSGASRSGGAIPYFVTTWWMLAELLLGGALVWAIQRLQGGERGRVAAALIVAAEIGLAFLRGRRALLALVFLGVLAALFGDRHVRRRSLALMGVAALLCVVVLFPLFFATREHLLRGEGRAPGDLASAVDQAWNTWDRPDIARAHEANVAHRARILGFVEDLLEQQEKGAEPMQGTALLDMRAAVPTALLPDKRLWLSSETRVLAHHGLPVRDVASTWPAYGVADFGPWGALVAGLLLGLLLAAAEWAGAAARRRNLRTAAAAVYAAWLALGFQVELNPSGVWVLMRDSVLILGAAFLLQGLARVVRT